MTCTHETSRYVIRYERDPETGEEYDVSEWETKGTWKDIDLHRFRCTQCGLVRYYSETARKFYEEGKGELP
jgi:hypothetical protein